MRPRPLGVGALGGLLHADERGVTLWAAGALVEHDWSAAGPAWSRPQPCRGAAACEGLGLVAVLAPGGLRLLPGLRGEASAPREARVEGPLAAAAGQVACLDPQGAVLLLGPGLSELRWAPPGPALALAFSLDGALLACASGGGRREPGELTLLAARGPRRGEVVARATTPGPCRLLCFAPDGARLVACWGRQIGLWTADGLAAGELDEQPGEASALAVSPSGDRVAVGYVGGPVALWNFPLYAGRGSYAGAVDGHGRTVRGLRFVAGGAGLVSASDDQGAALWELPAAAPRRRVAVGTAPIEALALAPGGGRLLAGHGDGSLSLRDAASGAVERSMGNHARGTFAVAFSPDGGLLASGGADGVVRLWGARRGDLRAEGQAAGQVQGLAFARGLLLVADDGGVGRWPLPLGALVPGVAGLSLRSRLPRPFPRLGGAPAGPCHAVLAAGPLVAASGADGRVFLADVEKIHTIVEALPGHGWSLALSPDGGLLACGGDGGQIALIDVRFGERVLRLSVPGGRVWSLAFAPGGGSLAAAGGDGAVRLVDLATGKVTETLPGHGDAVTAALWAPGGLISAARDGTLISWEAAP